MTLPSCGHGPGRRAPVLSRLASGAFASVVGLLVAEVGGCGLDTEGNPSAECKLDVDCAVAGDFCRIASCSGGGVCAFAPAPDGEAPIQIPGDCQRVTCATGVETSTDDPTDIDDGNPCTTDGCAGGEPTHTPLDGVSCGAGVCTMGVCEIPCAQPGDCPDMLCQAGACDLEKNVCVYTPDHGTLVENVDADDCLETRCVNGTAAAVAADAEIPDDSEPCTTDSCKDGVAVFAPAAADQPCGVGLKCDGQGSCVGCTGLADCPTGGPCQSVVCASGTCSFDLAPAGTVVGDPTDGDCQQSVCDSLGQPTSVADNSDEPPADADECNYETCSGGVPSQQPVSGACDDCPSAPACVCTQTGECHQCVVDSDCPAPGGCATAYCDNSACATSNASAGTDPGNDCAADPASTCGNSGECNGSGACALHASATECVPASCSNGLATPGSTCDGAGSCVPTGAASSCDPFACNRAGTACVASCTGPGDCAAGYECDGSGACLLASGAPCLGGGSCASGICDDGVCCQSGCGVCQNCLTGACANDPPLTVDPTCQVGEACDGAGACKKTIGQTCGAGGECISGACCGTPIMVCSALCP